MMHCKVIRATRVRGVGNLPLRWLALIIAALLCLTGCAAGNDTWPQIEGSGVLRIGVASSPYATMIARNNSMRRKLSTSGAGSASAGKVRP